MELMSQGCGGLADIHCPGGHAWQHKRRQGAVQALLLACHGRRGRSAQHLSSAACSFMSRCPGCLASSPASPASACLSPPSQAIYEAQKAYSAVCRPGCALSGSMAPWPTCWWQRPKQSPCSLLLQLLAWSLASANPPRSVCGLLQVLTAAMQSAMTAARHKG